MRLTTIDIPHFQHDGLVVGTTWSQFSYQRAEPKTQESFRAHVGRYIKVHPDDLGELAGLGLALERGRIVEAKSKPKAK